MLPEEFHILVSLADGERHGYGILQEIAERTGRKMIMGPGALYGSIKCLIEAGLVEEAGEHGDGERRRYYRLTRAGRAAAVAEAEQMLAPGISIERVV